MKKSMIALLLALLCASALPTGGLALQGDGSADSPYRIGSEADLREFGRMNSNAAKNKYFRLTADIDLTGKDPWTPVSFGGTFDGDGHVITGLKVDRNGDAGLFVGMDPRSRVRNLGLNNCDIRGTGRVGGIAGSIEKAYVENCFVTGKISGPGTVGGIAGEARISSDDGDVTFCCVAAELSGGSVTDFGQGVRNDGTVGAGGGNVRVLCEADGHGQASVTGSFRRNNDGTYTKVLSSEAKPDRYYAFTDWTRRLSTSSKVESITDNPYTFIPGDLISAGSVTLTAHFRALPITYSVTAGDGQTWYRGQANPARFTFKGSPNDANTFANFTGLRLNGADVSKEKYEAEKGSVVVSLKASYLEGLKDGSHELTAVFTDGEADAGFKVAQSPGRKPADTGDMPKTGDGSQPALWGLLAAACAGAVAAIRIRRKKK